MHRCVEKHWYFCSPAQSFFSFVTWTPTWADSPLIMPTCNLESLNFDVAFVKRVLLRFWSMYKESRLMRASWQKFPSNLRSLSLLLCIQGFEYPTKLPLAEHLTISCNMNYSPILSFLKTYEDFFWQNQNSWSVVFMNRTFGFVSWKYIFTTAVSKSK